MRNPKRLARVTVGSVPVAFALVEAASLNTHGPYPVVRGDIWQPHGFDSFSGYDVFDPDPSDPDLPLPVEDIELVLPSPVHRKVGFRAWLLQQSRRQDDIGDIAKDMRRDLELPETDDPRELVRHLQTFPADELVISCLGSAWLEYHHGCKVLPLNFDHLAKLLQRVHSTLKGFQGTEEGEYFFYYLDRLLSRLELALSALDTPQIAPTPPPKLFDEEGDQIPDGFILLAKRVMPAKVVLESVRFFLSYIYPDRGLVMRLLDAADRYLEKDILDCEYTEMDITQVGYLPHWREAAVAPSEASLSIWEHMD